ARGGPRPAGWRQAPHAALPGRQGHRGERPGAAGERQAHGRAPRPATAGTAGPRLTASAPVAQTVRPPRLQPGAASVFYSPAPRVPSNAAVAAVVASRPVAAGSCWMRSAAAVAAPGARHRLPVAAAEAVAAVRRPPAA